MPIVAPPSLQLDLFLRDTAAYQQALARYDRLRPILQGQATLTQQSRATGILSFPNTHITGGAYRFGYRVSPHPVLSISP